MKSATKKTAKKTEGVRGRQSAFAGKKLQRLMKTEDTGLRDSGKVRQCWDAIKDGITFEKYRENTGLGGFACKALAYFVQRKFVKAVDGAKAAKPAKKKETEAAAV